MLKKAISLLLSFIILLYNSPLMISAANSPSSWAVKEVNDAVSCLLVPESLQKDYQKNITRQEFCVLVVTLSELLDKTSTNKAKNGINPFHDTKNTYVVAAFNLGYVEGKKADTFDPNGEITRQEAALLLKNVATKQNYTVKGASETFSDNAKVSSWAKNGVDFVSAAGLMNGDKGDFNPTGKFSLEQAIITTLRLYNALLSNTDMKITSIGILKGILADEYGMRGKQQTDGVPTRSLPITITDAPKETICYAIIMTDPDSIPLCGYAWVHWLAVNMTDTVITDNASIDEASKMAQGKNDFGSTGYGGPTPPDKTHTYKITVYALDTMLELKNGFTRDELVAAMNGHILAQKTIDAKYSH